MTRICILLVSVMMCMSLTGCSLFKKKPSYDNTESYLDVDSPLDVYPLENFYEPSGADSLYFKDIHFQYNQYKIRMEDKVILDGIASWLQEHGKKHLLVEGHCDERGTNEYNLALGEQRALAVRQYIIDLGVESGRVQTISYGEERPIDPGHDEGAWGQNRRAHFLISD